jgi:hypothetical protein
VRISYKVVIGIPEEKRPLECSEHSNGNLGVIKKKENSLTD